MLIWPLGDGQVTGGDVTRGRVWMCTRIAEPLHKEVESVSRWRMSQSEVVVSRTSEK